MNRSRLAALAAALLLGGALAPTASSACASAAAISSVSAGSLSPTDAGGTAFVEYDFADQNRNWSGASGAPAADNDDKEIRTNFITLGGQYMVNRRWGVMVELPVWNRLFRTENDAGTGVGAFNHTAIGDVRLMGVYTGFSQDMSTGVTFGVKLPTGDWRYPGFDRDTAIGSGSTDILVGGFHQGALTHGNSWSWFVQALADLPVATQGGYRPGREVDGAAGVYFNRLTLAGGKVKIAPMLQLIGGVRAKDGGPAANPTGSGYERLLFSPGVEVSAGAWRVYGDVEKPIYQRVNGNQLVAPALFKLTVSHSL